MSAFRHISLLALVVLYATFPTRSFSSDATESASCEPPPSPRPDLATRELLSAELEGLALDDMRLLGPERRVDPAVAMLVAQAPMVEGAVRAQGAVDLTEILSVSIESQTQEYWIVDVMGRHARFRDDDKKPPASGRVGLVRVAVPIAEREGLSDVGPIEPLAEWSFADLTLYVEASIADWIAVVNEPTIGFRRLYPLGGGAIDRGVRVVGVTTSLTPTTHDAVLDKRVAYRELNNPWYFKKKPYLPLSVARETKRGDGTTHKFYVESNIAFHIWQAKGFDRGFFSHGCMRMRTEDLAELASFVFAAPKPVATAVYMGQRPDVHHPFPMSQTYWEMYNAGTPEKPRFVLEYGQIYKTVLATTPLPPPEDLIPLDFRDRPVRDEKRGATGEPSASPTTQPPTP